MTTFATLLDRLLRAQPGRPLITFYDGASGERTELSVATYANWVAKCASLMVEECDLGRGDRLRLDLPAHWLGPVFLGAAWTAGLQVVWDDDADAVVCGPETLPQWAGRADRTAVLASALLPLAGRFPGGVPPGVRDLGVEVWGQPDAFTPWDPPDPSDPALPGASQAELWAAAAAGDLVGEGGRLLCVDNPATADGLDCFLQPFARGGSLVLVRHPGAVDLGAIADAERVTAGRR